jgi:hypothetical protein
MNIKTTILILILLAPNVQAEGEVLNKVNLVGYEPEKTLAEFELTDYQQLKAHDMGNGFIQITHTEGEDDTIFWYIAKDSIDYIVILKHKKIYECFIAFRDTNEGNQGKTFYFENQIEAQHFAVKVMSVK